MTISNVSHEETVLCKLRILHKIVCIIYCHCKVTTTAEIWQPRSSHQSLLELTSKVNAEHVVFLIEPLPEIAIDFPWERAMV